MYVGWFRRKWVVLVRWFGSLRSLVEGFIVGFGFGKFVRLFVCGRGWGVVY